MDVKLKWVRVSDRRLIEWWHHRDPSGEIDPEVATSLKLDAEVDGRSMGVEWTADSVAHAQACGCGDCAECRVASEIEAQRRLPVAA